MSDDDRPDMPPPAQQVIGYSPAEQAMADRIDGKIAALNAALDERIAALTPSKAEEIAAWLLEHADLLAPALGLLGVSAENQQKVAEAERIIHAALAAR